MEEAPNSTCIGRSLAETGQVETDIYCGRVHVQGCHSPLLILFSFRVGHLVLYEGYLYYRLEKLFFLYAIGTDKI